MIDALIPVFAFGICTALVGILFIVAVLVIAHKAKQGRVNKLIKAVVEVGKWKLLSFGATVTLLGVIILTVSIVLNAVFNQWAAIVTFMFNSKACTCEVKCSGETDDDFCTSYELKYGSEKWEQFVHKLSGRDYFSENLNSMTGAEKSEYIIQNIPRDEFTEEEWNLLQDQKVNGRNKNCPVCRGKTGAALRFSCNGARKHTDDPEVMTGLWSDDDWLYYDRYGDIVGEMPGLNDDPNDPNNNNTPVGWQAVSTKGKATGKYVVHLDDGDWYWYHQNGGNGNDICFYCGDWSGNNWGSAAQLSSGDSNKINEFGEDGCGIYSLAMILSNLYDKDITPTQILLDLDTKIGTYNGKASFITSSEFFDGRGIRDRAHVLERLSQKYGFVYAPANTIAEWDEALAKGGYIWDSWWDHKIIWCKTKAGSTNRSHFMAIRKAEGDNYYCLTSCRGDKEATDGFTGKDGAIHTMNKPINKTIVLGSRKYTNMGFAIWNPNMRVNGDIYDLLRANGFDDRCAKQVAVIYATIAPNYGSNSALAMAACSLCEGRVGQFESLIGYMYGTSSYAKKAKTYTALRSLYQMPNKTDEQKKAVDTFERLSGKVISCAQDALDYRAARAEIKKLCDSDAGMGIGCIQMSGGRCEQMLDAYIASGDYSEAGLYATEAQGWINQIETNSKFKKAFINAQMLTTPQAAVDSIFRVFVSGGSSEGIQQREAKMESICNALRGTEYVSGFPALSGTPKASSSYNGGTSSSSSSSSGSSSSSSGSSSSSSSSAQLPDWLKGNESSSTPSAGWSFGDARIDPNTGEIIIEDKDSGSGSSSTPSAGWSFGDARIDPNTGEIIIEDGD